MPPKDLHGDIGAYRMADEDDLGAGIRFGRLLVGSTCSVSYKAVDLALNEANLLFQVIVV